MVKKYVILANSNDETFDIPRQMIEINGEPLVKRTIRLLKENGINDIIITSSNKAFDNLGVERYEPLNNDFDYINRTGYWLNAFPFELMNESLCFVWGDVYFSENAIKTIVETESDKNLFFCSYQNKNEKYIKEHDEPFAYKIVDTELFKEHIEKVKRMYDEGKTVRHPIVWEVYRSMNNIDVNEHKMTENFVAINDETCDIDSASDVKKIKEKVEERKMMKLEAIINFTLERFDEIKIISRKAIDTKGRLYPGDVFECNEEIANYVLGDNDKKVVAAKLIEITPIIGEPVYETEKVVEQIGKETIKSVKTEKPKKRRISKSLKNKEN